MACCRPVVRGCHKLSSCAVETVVITTMFTTVGSAAGVTQLPIAARSDRRIGIGLDSDLSMNPANLAPWRAPTAGAARHCPDSAAPPVLT
eukprot:SAG31_NODE_3574_length_4113_cov_2.614848_2_plen_90_part_00